VPTRAKRLCSHPGCNELTTETYCEEHKREKRQQEYRERNNRWLYLYHDPRWANPVHGLRAQTLREEPICRQCIADGYPWGMQAAVSTVADHIVPHKGNTRLFYDRKNLQGLCKRHHDIKSATEDGGFGRGRK
jgi:5-methylcytosine-specific restriction protein A